MLSIPAKINERDFDLFVILEQENLDRMREHDPAEVVKSLFGPPWSEMQIRNVVIAYLAPEDRAAFLGGMKKNPQLALRWLSRGFRYRPDSGDSDEDYQRA